MSHEPVATAGVATAVASLIVIIGKASGWWTITSDQAFNIAVGVVGVVGVVGSLFARRKVTPNAKLPTPPAPGR